MLLHPALWKVLAKHFLIIYEHSVSPKGDMNYCFKGTSTCVNFFKPCYNYDIITFLRSKNM